VRDDELAKLLPVREAVVEVELQDGAGLSERVSAVRGTPRNPMTRDEVIAKARDLTAPVLGRDTSTRLIETILDVEKVAEVRNLRRLLQRG
jgi:2-methylcitrate dehydratase PrpD